MRRITFVIVLGLTLSVATNPLTAEDWPQWRGAERLAIWDETGIVDELPDALKVTWRVPIRGGYAGPAVDGGRVFVTDWVEDPASRTMDGTERLLVLDEETGAVLWTHEWSATYRMLMASYAIGPRATPTVDGDRVYVLGATATGRLFCVDVDDGAVIWQKDYAADYDSSIPTWETSSPPLVDGDRLIAVVGGKPDAMVVAFDKQTGDEVWRSIETAGERGYSPPIIFEAGGVRQLFIWHPSALASLDPETGAFHWSQAWEAGAGMAIAMPFKSGDYLLVSQLYNGSMMMRLNQDRPAATMPWKGEGAEPGRAEEAAFGDHDTALHRRLDLRPRRKLRAPDARRTNRRTGVGRPRMTAAARNEWGVPRWATAFLVKQGDRYFANTDDGYLVTARFTPDRYEELGRVRLIAPTHAQQARRPPGVGPDRQLDAHRLR